MPFVKRKIEPFYLRQHQEKSDDLFEEHIEVANNALVRSLLQLSSLTFQAEDIFSSIEENIRSAFKRCDQVSIKIDRLCQATRKLNPKEVAIPMSDLGTEEKIPAHLHYRSSNSVDENFFMPKTRTRCIIHLHQQAKKDRNGVVRSSESFLKSFRSSNASEVLSREETHSRTKALSRNGSITHSDFQLLPSPQSLLPTPEEKTKTDCSRHKAEVVTVDTSGSQFERRVVLRRSQRSSISAVRRRSQLKYRSRHLTMSCVPVHSGIHSDASSSHRPNSALSEANSSFLGDVAVSGAGLNVSKQTDENQIEKHQVLSASAKSTNRYSVPVSPKSSPLQKNAGAHVSLQKSLTEPTETGPGSSQTNAHLLKTNVHLNNNEEMHSHNYEQSNERNTSSHTDDRISSGFWSGSESCRHSTTSEILLQHHSVTQALHQILAKNPSATNRVSNVEGDSTSDSTVSVNSHLSTFHRSPQSSSVFSFDLSDRNSLTPDDGSVFASGAPELASPCAFNFPSPAGAYNFMNPGYVDHCISLAHLPSPMGLIKLGKQPSSGSSAKVHCQTSSPKASLNSSQLENEKRSSRYASGRNHSQASNSIHSNYPETRFFGPKFSSNDESTPQVQQSYSNSSANEVKKTKKKPPPPQRSSSIQRSGDFPVQVPFRTKLPTAAAVHEQNGNSYYQTPKSSPVLKGEPSDANQVQKAFTGEEKKSAIGSGLNSDDTAQENPVKMMQETSEERFPITSSLAESESAIKFQKAVAESRDPKSDISVVAPLADVTKSHSPSSLRTSQVVSKPSCKSSTIVHYSLENQDVESHVPAQIEERILSVHQNVDGTTSVISLQKNNDTVTKQNCSEVTEQQSAPIKISESSKFSPKLIDSTDDNKGSSEAILPLKIFSFEEQEKGTHSFEISQCNSTSPSMTSAVTSSEVASSPAEVTTQEIKLQTLPVTSTNVTSITTSSTTTPPRVKKTKPALKPKPKSFSRNRSQVAAEQADKEKQGARQKTASARAAFFGVSVPSSATENNVLQESCGTPNEQEKISGSKESTDSESSNDVIAENGVTVIREDKFERQETDHKIALNSIDCTRKKECVKEAGFVEVDLKTISSDADQQFVPGQTGCDHIETSIRDAVSETTRVNDSAIITKENPKGSNESLSSSEASVHYPLRTSNMAAQEDGLKATETLQGKVTQNAFHGKISPYDATTTTSGNELKSQSLTETLGASAIQTDVKSVRTAAYSGNSASELRSQNLESKSYTAAKASHALNAIPFLNGSVTNVGSSNRRQTSSNNSLEDFKAKLLQNHTKTSTGAHLSASEKLKRSARLLSSAYANTSDQANVRHGIVSAGDIRAVLTSRARRSNYVSDHRRSLTDPKKPSARRYNLKNRVSLPVTPMHSISEDIETDEMSGDKLTKAKPRSISVTDL